MFITNNSLVIKTRVIRRIIHHDAVFVEGIKFNINATLHEQKRRMVPLYRKTDLDALKNTNVLLCILLPVICQKMSICGLVNAWPIMIKKMEFDGGVNPVFCYW